jgi:hypothetical protein
MEKKDLQVQSFKNAQPNAALMEGFFLRWHHRFVKECE